MYIILNCTPPMYVYVSCCTTLLYAVTVNFQSSTCVVQENGRRRNIQLVLSSSLSDPVSVVIMAENITAIGEQDNY